MPKASEVAAELRKLAEALDAQPDADLEPLVIRSYHIGESQKRHFLNLANLFPRPFRKEYVGTDLVIRYGHDWKTPVAFTAKIDRHFVCRLIKPAQDAVYECEPLLSDAEEAQIGGAA